jgi:hypothetical protein
MPVDIVTVQFARHCFLISGAGFTSSAVAVIAGLDEIDTGALRAWLLQVWRRLCAQGEVGTSFHRARSDGNTYDHANTNERTVRLLISKHDWILRADAEILERHHEWQPPGSVAVRDVTTAIP